MFFILIPLSAQSALPAAEQGGTLAADEAASVRESGGKLSESEKDLLISTEPVSDFSSGSGTNTLWLFIRMVFVLALVIACIYALVFFLKKGFSQKVPENPFLKKAVSLSLSPGKTLHVVTMPGKAWLIGVCESSVNLIGEITDTDLVNQLILESEKTPAETPKDFAGILASFTAVTKQAENVLKKQRRRFEKGDGNE